MPKPQTQVTTFKFTPADLDLIQRVGERLSGQLGITVSRADAIRASVSAMAEKLGVEKKTKGKVS